MTANNRLPNIIVTAVIVLLIGLAGLAFILTYDSLKALADVLGVSRPAVMPLIVEIGILIGTLALFARKQLGVKGWAWLEWTFVGLLFGLALAFNAFHALGERGPLLPVVHVAMFLVPTAALFLAIKIALGLVDKVIVRAGHITTLVELAAKISSDRETSKQLSRQIDNLTGKRDTYEKELGAFGELSDIRAAIESTKANNKIWYDLSKYFGKHTPKKDLGGWAELRNLVWLRDQKTCQSCRTNLETLTFHCHHILPESSGGYGEPTNLVTLCEMCHKKAHRKPLFSSDSDNLTKARASKQEKIKERREAVAAKFLAGWEPKKIAEFVGVTAETVRKDLKTLELTGKAEVGPVGNLAADSVVTPGPLVLNGQHVNGAGGAK